MEISIEELNTLLEKEFERGKRSIMYYHTSPWIYTYGITNAPRKMDYTITCNDNNCATCSGANQQRDDLTFTC